MRARTERALLEHAPQARSRLRGAPPTVLPSMPIGALDMPLGK
jgi:hypothetical protein